MSKAVELIDSKALRGGSWSGGRDDARRALRGGAFYDLEFNVRCASRFNGDPDYRDLNLGFRVVLSPKKHLQEPT